jgi:hypothetical protein
MQRFTDKLLQYITWISNNKIAWTLNAAGMAADPTVQISARPVSQEPMVSHCFQHGLEPTNHLPQYIIANLGMSNNFGNVDLGHLPFPVHLQVDYVRVYQPKNAVNIGCNPRNFPTQDYINEYVWLAVLENMGRVANTWLQVHRSIHKSQSHE